ncbi:MAG: hypothetical protein ACK5CH_07995, partial [Bacteroidota bacterium]
MKKHNYYLLLLSLIAFPGVGKLYAQNTQPVKVLWYTLSSIPLDGTWKPNQEPPFPLFTEQVKQLDGKMVSVEGFAIPLDPTGNQVTLSANPYSACFFCGKAGPASI